MTLLELLIVVMIIGILAAVGIPKYKELMEKANLGATLGNLGSIRSAISMYFGAHTDFPYTIADNGGSFSDSMGSGGLPAVKSTVPSGNSPAGKEVELASAADEVPAYMRSGWFYDYFRGRAYINSTALSIKGESYTMY